MNVARVEPYMVTDVEWGDQGAHVVSGQLVGRDGDSELFLEVIVETGQVVHHLRHLRAGDLFDIDFN